jgi:hypothetical protein
MRQRTLPLPAVLAGVLAGLAGAVSIDAYLIVVLVLGFHSIDLAGFYQFIASGAIGQAAYAGPGGAVLGVALHLIVSLAWGVGYAYVAARTPQVVERPLVSGITFGIVVMLAMQLVEVAGGIYRQPDTFSLANALVANVLFFGIPVAYIVRWKLNQAR